MRNLKIKELGNNEVKIEQRTGEYMTVEIFNKPVNENNIKNYKTIGHRFFPQNGCIKHGVNYCMCTIDSEIKNIIDDKYSIEILTARNKYIDDCNKLFDDVLKDVMSNLYDVYYIDDNKLNIDINIGDIFVTLPNSSSLDLEITRITELPDLNNLKDFHEWSSTTHQTLNKSFYGEKIIIGETYSTYYDKHSAYYYFCAYERLSNTDFGNLLRYNNANFFCKLTNFDEIVRKLNKIYEPYKNTVYDIYKNI